MPPTDLEKAELLLAECLHMCNDTRNRVYNSAEYVEGINDTYGLATAIEKYFKERQDGPKPSYLR